MENYKELLTALYKDHAPEKLDQIDFYLDRYKGKEKQFYITQKAKYANKRSVTDSKKILAEAMARISKAKKTKEAAKKVEKVSKPIEKKDKEPKVEPTPKPKETAKPVIKTEEKKVTKAKDINTPIKKRTEVVNTEDTKKKEIISETPKKDIVKEDKKPIIAKTKAVINPPIAKPVKVKKEVIEEKKKPEVTPEPPKKQKEDSIPQTIIDSNGNKTLRSTAAKIAADEKRERELDKLNESKARLIESQKKEKKKASVIWYFGGVALVVLLVATYVYFAHFYQGNSGEESAVNTQTVVMENQTVTTEKTANVENDQVKTSAETEEPVVPKKEVEKPAEQKTTPKKEAPKEEPKEQTYTQPTADRLYADDIYRPAIFVACFAVKNETLAQKKVALLKEYNLEAHYYWIPEIDANGKNYFKVVVGPFKTMADSYPSLTKTQERINFDAYLLLIN